MDKLSSEELVERIKPRITSSCIPTNTTDIILKEEITGGLFKKLTLKYMEEIFPDISKGKRLQILLLRDEMCNEEEETILNLTTLTEVNVSGEETGTCIDYEEKSEDVALFRETFRAFDKDVTFKDNYRQNALVKTSNYRPSNLLDPVRKFSIVGVQSEIISAPDYSQISDEVVEFVAACLNERTNGTLHIGIETNMNEYQMEGIIRGIQIDNNQCVKQIYLSIEERFYKEQQNLVLKCMRSPKFIDVTCKPKLSYKLKVLEIDIVPQSSLVAEEAFFVKSIEGSSPMLYLFEKNEISTQSVSDERCISYMSKDKKQLSDIRRNQETHSPKHTVKEDLRQKIVDLLSAGDETISSAMYPLLFVSPFDSNIGNTIDMNNFEFFIDLDANAIFDFDYAVGPKGLYEFVDSDKEQALKALTTDNFDPNSNENQFREETLTNLLEDIKTSSLKPWIFCNGYHEMNKPPLNILEWKKSRSKGFQEAIRFYSTEIPRGRALVLFFLLSKDYEIMLEVAEHVILNFQDHWVLFAESEDIANHWQAELINRHIVEKEQIVGRSVIGMPWNHLNQTIKELTCAKRANRCEIPTSNGSYCHLKEKKKNDLVDLEILSRNECEDQELARDQMRLAKHQRDEQEKFYKGENVSWWNFWFHDHVLKRKVHEQLMEKVKDAMEGRKAEDDNKIGLVNIYHQPGAGGTTTARHILWDLKRKYRCCIVKQITDQTVDQITALRNYEETDDPKPPLILIENGDEEKVGEMFALLQNRARIVARRSTDMKVFCVLFLCTRRTNIPNTIDDASVALKHELSEKELMWFTNRSRDLEKRFLEKEGPDPRFLISFNILKENFNYDYIHRTAVELVKGVTDEKERRVLKYLSMLNTFDLEWQPIPISAFDPIMINFQRGNTFTFGLANTRNKHLNKAWEQTISQPLQVLLNRTSRAGFGSQLKGLSIVNPLFAAEIFSCFNQPPDTLSMIFMEFLDCPIFKSFNNLSCKELKKIVRSIMKKREEKDDTRKVKFSPLIMKLLEDENEEMAAKILIQGFDMTQDPMLCQQIARLYIHCKNWGFAAKYAKISTDMKPQNSFLWDTYGQVFKNQLYEKFTSLLKEETNVNGESIGDAIEVAKSGLAKFKKAQDVSENERSANDAGYFGEIRMIVLLLDVLRMSPLGQQKDENSLHSYLTDKNVSPTEILDLKPEHVEFLKSLEVRSDNTLKTLEDKTIQLKDDTYYSLFGQNMPRRNALATLRENLDSYFGEESNTAPDHLSKIDKAEFRRRRVKRLGGRTLTNFRHIDDKEKLHIILDLLLENIKTEAWQPFDIITLINVVVAMRLLKINQTKLTYIQMVQLSRKCYERVVSSPEIRTDLEAYMYFVLLNWPTELRRHAIRDLCPVEQLNEAIKKWRKVFYAKHPRQKESRPLRKRETTNFFLGTEKDMDAIVHTEELHDPKGKKFVRGDTIWESAHFVTKLIRLRGTLVNDGTEINCDIQTGSGGTVCIPVPTSIPIGDKSLWQRRVYFVLGFSWAGIKAYDVKKEPPVPFDIQEAPQGVTRSKLKKAADMKQTHEAFIRKLNDLRIQIVKISKFLKRKGRLPKEKVSGHFYKFPVYSTLNFSKN